jgi:uncharacterized protein YukJ
MQAGGGTFTVAVNIQSVDGSEVLYAIEENFTPPDLAGLTGLPMGMTRLQSVPGGLALDYARSMVGAVPMITKAQMMLLPQTPAKVKGSAEEQMILRARAKALENAAVTLLNMTIADKNGVIYAFGSAYADKGKVDGIHDIHMNQGNPKNNHGGDNGVWQDGGFVYQPAVEGDLDGGVYRVSDGELDYGFGGESGLGDLSCRTGPPCLRRP